MRFPLDRQVTQKKDLSHLDRNLEALVQELAGKSRSIFDEAAKAVARTAILEPSWSAASQMIAQSTHRVAESESSRLSKLSRLRAVFDEKVRLRLVVTTLRWHA